MLEGEAIMMLAYNVHEEMWLDEVETQISLSTSYAIFCNDDLTTM